MIMINSMMNLHIRSWFLLLLLFLLTAASSFICDLASILVLPFPIPEKKSLSISLYYPFPSQIITIFPTKRSKSSRRDLASGGLKPSEGNSSPNWQYVTGGETQIHSISSWSLWRAKATHLWLPGLMTLMTNRHTIYSPSSWPTYGFQGSWRCHGLTRATLVGSLMLLIASW